MAQRDILTLIRAFQTILTDKLPVKKPVTQVLSLGQRGPVLLIGGIAAAVGKVYGDDLSGIGTDRIIRQRDGLLGAERSTAVNFQIQILVLSTADLFIRHIVSDDEDFKSGNLFCRDVLEFKLAEDFAGLTILEQSAGRDQHGGTRGIEIAGQCIEFGISFGHYVSS
jgi:hypothetical protein